MPSTSEVLKAYGQAWLEQDEAKRRELLNFAWADNGLYQDPSAEALGREALIKHIGGMHDQQPGARVELTSGHSEHHGRIQFNWQFVNPDGEVVIRGVDFGTLDNDGRLREIVGFFGPPPEL
ncbi:MAG: nuclear transport factor 2 family protein [Pseudomonadota bacterium]